MDEEAKTQCDHLGQICERLCRWRPEPQLVYDYETSAFDTVVRAMKRGEKYGVSYPFVEVGEIYRVRESGLCSIRFWLVAGDTDFVVHELSKYDARPIEAIEEFQKLVNPHFVITGAAVTAWEVSDSKYEDDVEFNRDEAWAILPLADLGKQWEGIVKVVDDVARRTIEACWTPSPHGAKCIADCCAHFKWQ